MAAQSTLANLFAGLQIAFSGSIRYGDAVIVEDEWGWIDEITLSYVVVRLWDDRNMVLPATYFTTTPFQNWTRKHSELLGSVEMDVDWRVSPDGMRRARAHPADDRTVGRPGQGPAGHRRRQRLGPGPHPGDREGRTDAVRPAVLRPRTMVDWLQSKNEGGLPRFRVESVERVPPKRNRTEPSGLFSGDDDGVERAARITGQLPAVDEPLLEDETRG